MEKTRFHEKFAWLKSELQIVEKQILENKEKHIIKKEKEGIDNVKCNPKSFYR